MSTTAKKITTTTVLKGVSPSSKALPIISNDFNPVIDDILDLENRVDAIEGGTVSLTQVDVADGTVALPSINFSSDPDTGIYRIGANNVGVTANGAKVLDIATTGLGVTGIVTVSSTTASTTKDTGAVIIEGGVGIEKEIYAGLSINAGTYLTSGDGTVALPAIGPVSDPDSGMYKVGANQLGFAVNAAKRLEVNTSGAGVVGYFVKGQIAPTNSDIDPADKAVMATSMLNGILTATPAGAIAYTLPTGTQMQTAAGTTIDVDQSIDFTLINIGAGGIITVTAAAAFTIVGTATVAVNTSANFRIRKTAANTFVLYRMA